jgi:hypothetical protein
MIAKGEISKDKNISVHRNIPSGRVQLKNGEQHLQGFVAIRTPCLSPSLFTCEGQT